MVEVEGEELGGFGFSWLDIRDKNGGVLIK